MRPMNSQNRIYCDYNATSPVAPNVLEGLSLGEWPLGNPSSVHATGKKARRGLNEVRQFLYQTFGVKEQDFQLFFHSGATEGINSLIKGLALKVTKEKKSLGFFTFESDHSCLVNQQDFLETLGHQFSSVKVKRDGAFDLEDLKEKMASDNSEVKLLNWTWVNNETGIINPLSGLEGLKKELGDAVLFHVDAVQAPGKIPNWNELSTAADAYTFSGHKFGALKGSGFSFLKESLHPMALLNGGGQQSGLRSGTENTWSILSLKLALEYLIKNYNFEKQNQATRFLEEKILKLVGDRGEVIGLENPHRNGNTIDLLLYGIKAHTSAMVFDMGSIDLSNGSACSSGAVVPSRVLLAMGYSEDEAKSALRFSFSPYFTKEEATELWPKIESILNRLFS